MPKGRLSSPPLVPALHKGQLQCRKRFKKLNFIAAGRGWRKSSLAVREALEKASSGKNVYWFTPTAEHYESILLDQFTKAFGPQWSDVYMKSDDMIDLRAEGWGIIKFRSLEKAGNSRGPTPDVVIGDEMGEQKDGDMENIIIPFLHKKPTAYFIGIGTPNTSNPLNSFWRWLTAEDRRGIMYQDVIPAFGVDFDKDGTLIRKPHPLENPEFTFEGMDDVLSMYEAQPGGIAKFKVEFLCKFIKGEGDSIQNVENACSVDWELSTDVVPKYDKNGQLLEFEAFAKGIRRAKDDGWYQYGADVAFSTNGDYVVIFILDRHNMQHVYMRRFRPAANLPEGRHAQVHDVLIRAWNLFPCKGYVDTTGIGNGAVEAMRLAGCGSIEEYNFGGTNLKKATVMGHLQDLIENNKLKTFKIPCVVREMIGLTISTEKNKTIYEAKGNDDSGQKLHDDIPIAAGLSCHNVDPPKILEYSQQDMQEYMRIINPDPIYTMQW